MRGHQPVHIKRNLRGSFTISPLTLVGNKRLPLTAASLISLSLDWAGLGFLGLSEQVPQRELVTHRLDFCLNALVWQWSWKLLCLLSPAPSADFSCWVRSWMCPPGAAMVKEDLVQQFWRGLVWGFSCRAMNRATAARFESKCKGREMSWINSRNYL